MKVLLDVNVVVDVLGATEDVLHSLQAVDIMLLRGFEPCVVVSSLPTAQYVLTARKYASKARAVDALKNFADLVTILDATEADFRQALASPLGDFEDAMLAWAAMRHGVDLIVTRNVRDFRQGPVAVMSPQQFCEAYRPANYEYELLEFSEEELMAMQQV